MVMLLGRHMHEFLESILDIVIHGTNLLRNSMEHDSELIDTQRIAGKGKLPCMMDESEPFNFGSLSPHQLVATE